MAYLTGTCTSNIDFLTQLQTFVCSDTNMGGTGLGWVAQRWDSTNGELILKGVGAGSDSIYIGLRKFGNNVDALKLNGYTGFSAGSDFYSQAGNAGSSFSPGLLPLVCLSDSQTTNFWIFANPYRIIGVFLNQAGDYDSFYLGYLSTYTTATSEYPYPLTVGGSCRGIDDSHRLLLTKPNMNGAGRRNWWNPGYDTDINTGTINTYSVATWKPVSNCTYTATNPPTQLLVMLPGGSWGSFCNYYGTDDRPFTAWTVNHFFGAISNDPVPNASYYDSMYGAGQVNYYRHTFPYMTRPVVGGTLDGMPVLLPTMLIDYVNHNILGEFMGCCFVATHDSQPQSTITVGADTYIVFPNITRYGSSEYIAIKQS